MLLKFNGNGDVSTEQNHQAPTQLTIARIRDKFETHANVFDVHEGRSGRLRT